MKRPITARALQQRVNRRLLTGGEKLVKARSQREASELGEYYTIDTAHNVIGRKNIDLEGLGRELGALAEYEALGKE